MRNIKHRFLITFLLCLHALSYSQSTELETVKAVELSSYLGKWYEFSRIPNKFQDNKNKDYGACYNTVAEYDLDKDNKLSVTNTCSRFNSKGESMTDVAKAKGFVVEGSENSKLKVNFTGIFLLEWLGIGNGDYWILGLGPINDSRSYSWAFVGSPKRNFGWILSRNRKLTPQEDAQIKELIVLKGYALDSLKSFIKD